MIGAAPDRKSIAVDLRSFFAHILAVFPVPVALLRRSRHVFPSSRRYQLLQAGSLSLWGHGEAVGGSVGIFDQICYSVVRKPPFSDVFIDYLYNHIP